MTSGIATARRRTKSPAPGQPPGNIVNNRCKLSPYLRVISHSHKVNVIALCTLRIPKCGDAQYSLGWFMKDLQLDDSALQSCGHGVGSVIDAKLGKNALDVALDRILRDR